jgi:hypothetical protein
MMYQIMALILTLPGAVASILVIVDHFRKK